jgi:hypothetical protein
MPPVSHLLYRFFNNKNLKSVKYFGKYIRSNKILKEEHVGLPLLTNAAWQASDILQIADKGKLLLLN